MQIVQFRKTTSEFSLPGAVLLEKTHHASKPSLTRGVLAPRVPVFLKYFLRTRRTYSTKSDIVQRTVSSRPLVTQELRARFAFTCTPTMAPSRALRHALGRHLHRTSTICISDFQVLEPSWLLPMRRCFASVTSGTATDGTTPSKSASGRIAPLQGIRVLDMTRVLAGVSLPFLCRSF